jgi:O-antigen/teichoic acid export membrane protein
MNFAQAFSITLIAQIIIVLSGILNNIIIVRMLGPEGQGVYALIMTTSVMLLIFGGAGLVTSNTYWVRKNKEEASVIFANSLIFAIVISTFVFLCYIAFGKDILIRFFMPEISLILVISLPLLLILEFNQGILWGLERYDYHNFINIFKAASLVLANLLLVLVLGLQINAAVLGWLAVISLTSIISTFILWKEIGVAAIFPKLSNLLRSLRIGIKVLIADITWFLSKRIDLYLVAFFLGTREVGFYSIAVLIMQLASVIPTILGRFIFNSSIIENQSQTQVSLKLIQGTLMYSLVFTLAIIALGKISIQTIFGQEFTRSFECLIFLLPATLVQNLNNSIGFFVAGRKAVPIYNVINIIITLISNVAFNIWLIPQFGIIGAAISSSMSQIIHFALLILVLKKFNLHLLVFQNFGDGFLNIKKVLKSAIGR